MKRSTKVVTIGFRNRRVIGKYDIKCDANREIGYSIQEREPRYEPSAYTNPGLCYIIYDMSENKPAQTFKKTFELFDFTISECPFSSFTKIWEDPEDYSCLIGIILLNKTTTSNNNSLVLRIINQLLENKLWCEKPKIFIVLKPSESSLKQELAFDGQKFSPTRIRQYHFTYNDKDRQSAEKFATTICDSVKNDGGTKSIQEIFDCVVEKMENDGQCVPTIGGSMNQHEKYMMSKRLLPANNVN